jgi:hypothetical protein
MRAPLAANPPLSLNAIPLLDASSLPADDDWAVLDSIHDLHGADFEPDADRFGRFNVSACYDE